MKPIYQTILKPPYGNCLSACVASILELTIDEVPNFNKFDDWMKVYHDFMSKFGVYPLRTIPNTIEGDPIIVEGYHIISGQSPRANGLHSDMWHSVVGFNGKPVHDPYPGGNCELRTIEVYDIFVSKMLMDKR